MSVLDEHTVVAEQKLLPYPEHPLGLARLGALDQFLKAGFVA